jgi:hypothetical protein
MTRYLPTPRGWIAFILSAFAILYFPTLCPALFVESGVGTFVRERVTPTVWVKGAVLIVACLLASIEAFRRGSRVDKWFAGVSVLLTLGLAVQYFELVGLSVHKSTPPRSQRLPLGSRSRTLCLWRGTFATDRSAVQSSCV